MLDPIIEEIRRVREEIAKQFGYDAQAFGRYLMRQQKKSGHPMVDYRAAKTVPQKPRRRRALGLAISPAQKQTPD
jgi:hypothetical protein